jgi:hypothetical protein
MNTINLLTSLGHWEHGAKHGHGVQSWRDSKYTGSFRHGRRHGYGRMGRLEMEVCLLRWLEDGQRLDVGFKYRPQQILHCSCGRMISTDGEGSGFVARPALNVAS